MFRNKGWFQARCFYVSIPDVSRYNKISDESLFLHEAVPGHHYQLSLQQENKDLPFSASKVWAYL
jgi:uncharacterized protein (DUF885 family)